MTPTTTTDAPTTQHRRDRSRSSLFTITDVLLLPLDLPGLPEPVEQANAHAHDMVRAMRDAERAFGEARDQAAAAPRHDQIALEAAIAAGEKEPKPTVPAKTAAVEAAEQRHAAAENAAKAAVRALYDAVEDHLPAYRDGRERAYAAETKALPDALRALVETFGRAQTEAQLVELARDWHNNPNSAALSTQHAGATWFDRQFAKALQRRREAVAAGYGTRTPIEPEPVPLLAALIVALESGTSESLPVEMHGRAAW